MEWIDNNVQLLLSASNFTVSFFMMILGGIVTYFIFTSKFTKHTDIIVMLTGVSSLCFSLMIHQFFWGLHRLSNYLTINNMYAWFSANELFLLVPSVLILASISLVISPAIASFLPKGKLLCYFVTPTFMLSVYWFILIKISEQKAIMLKNKVIKNIMDILP